MALALDASSPAFVTGTANPATTASFTPPDDSKLVAFVIADEANTFVVSGGGLTWSQPDSVSPSGFNSAAVWVADIVGTSPGSMTVSSTRTGSFTANALKVAVFTGAEVGFTGAHGNNTNSATITYTATQDGSWGWVAFGNQGGGTGDAAATGCAYDAVETAFGGVSGGVIKRSTADGVSGSGTTIGIATHNFSESFVALEIKSGGAVATAGRRPNSWHPGRGPNRIARFYKPPRATSAVAVVAAADATLTASGSLTAAADVVKPVNATLTATGTLSASGTSTKPVDASLSATGSLSVSAASTKPIDAALTGSGTLTATASVGAAPQNADATLTATGTITATAATTKPVDAALTGVGTVAATGASVKSLSATLTATGSAIATAAGTKPAAASLTGTGSFTATGTSTKPIASSLVAIGTATAVADIAGATGFVCQDFSAVAALDAYAGTAIVDSYSGVATLVTYSGTATVDSYDGTATNCGR